MLKTVLYTEGVGMKVAGTGEIFIEPNETEDLGMGERKTHVGVLNV